MINYYPNIIFTFIDSPSLFVESIYNQNIKLFLSANNSDSKIKKYIYEQLADYKNTSITILQFALCEYDIYSEFNQIIISLASCLICAKEKENENIYLYIKDIINNINIDFSLIEKCISKIISIFNSEEENSDENTNDEESPRLNFQKDNIISLTNIIENDIINFEKKIIN